MPNVISVGPSPAPQIIGQFLDQYNANRRADQQDALGREQLALGERSRQDTASYQQGTLKDAQDKFALLERTYNDEQKKAEAKQYIDRMGSYHDAIQSLPENDPKRVALETQAKAEAAAIPPELMPYVKLATLAPILTPQRQAGLNANVQAAAATGRTAAGGTDPNDYAQTLKIGPAQAFPTPQMFTQQQATDLARRDAAPDSAGTPTPDLSRAVPPPSGNAVSDFEARSTSAMPTSADSLTSQTQVTTEGMRQAGETKRTGMTNATQVKVAGMAAARVPAGSVNQDQAHTIADEIIAGRQQPHLEARIAGPVKAALGEKHYDLAKAEQDWTATQKYLSTLNGPGQVRLRQAVDFAYESIPLVDNLAKEWQGGGFPLLNSARLIGAKQGLLGPQAQQIATKLDQQIVEMQAELAVVYRGGNSPTDEAMKQAAHILQTNWSLPTLQAALGLLQQNLLIRRNSIVSAGVATNAGNSYAPNVSIAAPGGSPAPASGGNPLGLTPPGGR